MCVEASASGVQRVWRMRGREQRLLGVLEADLWGAWASKAVPYQ